MTISSDIGRLIRDLVVCSLLPCIWFLTVPKKGLPLVLPEFHPKLDHIGVLRANLRLTGTPRSSPSSVVYLITVNPVGPI